MKIRFVLSLGTGFLLILTSCTREADTQKDPPEPRSVAFQSRTMGTYATVIIATGDSAAAVPDARAAERVFAHVDSLMSNWTATSEVARLNREAGEGPVTVDPEVAAVLERAIEIGVASDSCFDITVEPLVRLWGFLGGRPHLPPREEIERLIPRVGWKNLTFDSSTRVLSFLHKETRIDLGGIAKGYGVDAVAAVLRERGVTHTLINLSGNMVALGHPPGQEAWVVGIRDPRDRVSYVARVSLNDEAVATSGVYEQFVAQDGEVYGHIMDPRTGWPSRGLLSVTVVAPTATEADAWGTALFVLGPGRAQETATRHSELGVILIQPANPKDLLLVERDMLDRVQVEPGVLSFIELRPF